MVAPTPDPAIGTRFGRLVVTSEAIRLAGKSHKYLEVLCGSGTTKVVEKQNLIRRTRSCGCYLKESSSNINRSHGKRKDPVYAIWNMMRHRCTLPTNAQYAYYGGRGIKVCDEWLTFENFYRDMGDPPFKGASLERRDSNGNYCK